MDSELTNIIQKVRNPEIDSISAIDMEGENLLHAVVRSRDIDAAKYLISKGIDIEQPGDLGHTPLHEACSYGNLEMVLLLVQAGADVHALSEGVPPFTLARYGNHDEVCDYLAKVMKRVQLDNPDIWKQARINQLRREIARLEQNLERPNTTG